MRDFSLQSRTSKRQCRDGMYPGIVGPISLIRWPHSYDAGIMLHAAHHRRTWYNYIPPAATQQAKSKVTGWLPGRNSHVGISPSVRRSPTYTSNLPNQRMN